MDKLETLDRFVFYRQAPAAFQATFAAVVRPLSVTAGAALFRQGDECTELALVGKGSVRVYRTGETGREITLYHVEDGQSCLVNMLSVLRQGPAVATATAEVPTEAVAVPASAMRHWVKSNDLVRDYIVEMMADRLITYMTLFDEVVFGKMDARLAALLAHRFESEHSFKATHEEIAAELGTAREVVSRLLKELVRVGAIQISRGHIELRDRAILHDRI